MGSKAEQISLVAAVAMQQNNERIFLLGVKIFGLANQVFERKNRLRTHSEIFSKVIISYFNNDRRQ